MSSQKGDIPVSDSHKISHVQVWSWVDDARSDLLCGAEVLAAFKHLVVDSLM